MIGCGDDRAYGTSTTLYERHPQTNEVAGMPPGTFSCCINEIPFVHLASVFSLGNPIADVFAVCARENNAILAIADGVNWGDKARVAAQCAVRGAVDFLEAVLFQDKRKFRTTKVRAKVSLSYQKQMYGLSTANYMVNPKVLSIPQHGWLTVV